MKYIVVSFLTILYASIWVTCLFILIGFLMPSPARFARSISGANKKKKKHETVSLDIDKDDYLFMRQLMIN